MKVIFFLKTLNHDLPENSNPTHLLSRTIDAGIFNQRQLDKLTGTVTTYTATINTGRHKYLDKILAQYHLTLKINCPVMLLRNFEGKLVNSLCGHVKELDVNYITIYFDRVNTLILIESMKLIKLRSITLLSMMVSTKNDCTKDSVPITTCLWTYYSQVTRNDIRQCGCSLRWNSPTRTTVCCN